MRSLKRIIGKEMYAWLRILIGCSIVAVGFVVFINPYHLVPGGVYGMSIILNGLMPQVMVGTFGYILQIPLLVLAALLLGKSLGARTVFTVLVTPAIMNILTMMVYPDTQAMQALDPQKMLGGAIDLSDNLVLAALFGGLMVGFGSGMIIRRHAGTGGTDIVAMILQKYLGIRFSRAILLVDGSIVFCGFAYSGNIMLSLYSLIAIFCLSRAVQIGINGTNDDKIIYVIANEDIETLRKLIVDELGLTSTCIPCQGMYSGEAKQMLMLVVRNKMVPKIVQRITHFSPDCFLIVADAYTAYGQRWKAFPSKNDLILD